jgi:hypothetical protein
MPAVETIINGLDAISVRLRPNYLYELNLETEVIVDALTAAGSYFTVFALHINGGVWDGWRSMGNAVHSLPLMEVSGTATECDEDIQFCDRTFAFATLVEIDAVRFGVYGDANNSTFALLQPSGCRAIITEYLP